MTYLHSCRNFPRIKPLYKQYIHEIKHHPEHFKNSIKIRQIDGVMHILKIYDQNHPQFTIYMEYKSVYAYLTKNKHVYNCVK